MISFIVAFIFLGTVVTVLGLGWSDWLRSRTIGGFLLPHVFLAPLVGLLINAVSWVWAFGVGGGYRGANFLTLILALGGYYLAVISRRSRSRVRIEQESMGKRRIKFAPFLLPCIALIVAASPSFGSVTAFSYPARIGPDAMGYAISARVLNRSLSYTSLQTETEQRTGYRLAELLAPDDPAVYSLPSFTDQVTTEFLLGALRWSATGLVASVTQFSGDANAYSTINILAALAIAVAMGILYSALRQSRVTPFAATVLTTSLVVSPATLIAWHDGFFAHILVLPFLTLGICVIWLKLSKKNEESNSVDRALLPLMTVAIIGTVSLYVDSLFFFVPLFVVLLGLLLIHKSSRSLGRKLSRTVLLSGIVSTVIVLPLMLRSVRPIIHQLNFKGGGYWQPTWLSPLELLGFTNVFTRSSIFSAVKHSSTSVTLPIQILLWLLGVALLVGITRALRSHPPLQCFNIAMLVTVSLVYLQSDGRHLNNYQYFKAASYALVPLLLIFASAMDHGRHLRKIGSNRSALIVIVAIMATSLGLYTLKFSPTRYAGAYSAQISRDGEHLSVSSYLESHNVLLKGGHVQVGSLAASTDIYWMHRGAGGRETDFSSRLEKPVAWLLFSNTGSDLNCIMSIAGPPDVAAPSGAFVLYKIAPDSREAATSGGAAMVVFQRFLTSHGLGTALSGWGSSVCSSREDSVE